MHGAAIRRARRGDLDDLRLHLQDIVRTSGLWPGDLPTRADDAISQWQARGEQFHGNGGGVPAARRQSQKERVPGAVLVQMKDLRVELPGECLDLFGVHLVLSTHETVAGFQVFQVQLDRCFLHRLDYPKSVNRP